MNHLFRELAPISDRAWEAIDEEATRTLRHFLSARKLDDFSGPHGLDRAAESTGRTEPIAAAPEPGVDAVLRSVQPLVELRVPFELPRRELDAIDRGALDPELGAVREAARRMAVAEDRAVFHGFDAGRIAGITEATAHAPVTITDDYDEYPRTVARAVARLQESGIGGPFGIALGPRCHTGVIETTERGGYPVFEHLRLILGGPVVWAPAVDGAVVLSLRGGDFVLTSGEDVSIGYSSHSAETVRLYLEETFTFRVLEPTAAVALVYES